MTASEREALVWRMVRTAGDLAAAGPDGAVIRGDKTEQFANDITALCAEVELLTRERDAAIAGALFDFAGHLTTMDEVYEVGASRDSTRMVAELQAWAKKRNLDLSDADVMGWQDALAARTTGGRDA